MRQRPWVLTGIATWLTIATSVTVNYATQFAPPWTRNPWIAWPTLAVLLGLSITVAILLARRSRTLSVSQRVPPPDSLRAPTLHVPVRGRGAELARLEELARRPRGRVAVICGPGGSGKTTLAAELAARVGATVWWVRFRDRDSFIAQMVQIIEILGVPHDPGQSLSDLVWSALAARSRWLLVMDNVDRPDELSVTDELLADYRGWVRESGGGLLLITSRNTDPRTWGGGAELIQLDLLSTEDAANVLLDAAPEAGGLVEAEALAARLGGFPLALHLAGVALSQPTARHRTFDAYRAALDSELGDVLAPRHDGPLTENQKRSLLCYTWELSLDQLADEGYSLARPLLRMLSLAADAPLPRDLITPELLQPALPSDVTPSAVDGALSGLHRYGLIGTRDRAVPCVTLHPLVREINALQLDDADGRAWRDIFDRIVLADAEKTVASGRVGLGRARLLVPHLAQIPARPDGRPEAILTALTARETLDRVASALHEAGDAASRVPLLRAVLDTERRLLGPDHPDTLASVNNLANALHNSGELAHAAELLAWNVADCERVLGPDHRATLENRNNLATTLDGLGKHAQAVELHARNLADRERVLASDHPDTLESRNNLASALGGLGEYGRALELLARNLGDCERALGSDHPDTFENRNNLAAVLGGLGEYGRAVALHERNLADRKRVLGPDHPETHISRDNLAVARAALEKEERKQAR